MADELRIGGTIDPRTIKSIDDLRTAMRMVDLEAKKGNISLADTAKYLKELDQVSRTLAKTQKEYQGVQEKLFQIQERTNTGFKSMARTYQEMLTAERLQNRMLGEMKQTMQSLSSVIGGEAGRQAGTLVGNFQGLEFALQSSGLAAGRMGGAFGALGTTLVGLATPIGIAGAAFLTLNGYMQQLEDETRSYLDTIDRLEGRTAAIAKRNLDAAKADEGGFLARVLSGTPGLQTLGMKMLKRDVWRTSAAEKQYQDAVKKDAETAAKSQAAGPLDMRYRPGRLGVDEFGAARSAFGGPTSGMAPGSAFSGRVRAPNAPDTAGSVKIAQDEFSAFQQSFLAGTANMASTFSSQVGGAFATVFGGAHTLLGSFASAFAATMAELAANWVIGKLIGATVGLVTGGGPIGAILGATGGTTLADTRGVGPGGAGGGTGGVLTEIRNAIQSMELRVDNVGIYMASQRGRVAYADR